MNEHLLLSVLSLNRTIHCCLIQSIYLNSNWTVRQNFTWLLIMCFKVKYLSSILLCILMCCWNLSFLSKSLPHSSLWQTSKHWATCCSFAHLIENVREQKGRGQSRTSSNSSCFFCRSAYGVRDQQSSNFECSTILSSSFTRDSTMTLAAATASLVPIIFSIISFAEC